MPLTKEQAYAITQEFFAIRAAKADDDLSGAAYTFVDYKDAADGFNFVLKPPANWEAHLFNSCLFIFSLQEKEQKLLFIQRAVNGTGGNYNADESRAGNARGDKKTLLKIPKASGRNVRVVASIAVSAFKTPQEMMTWVLAQFQRCVGGGAGARAAPAVTQAAASSTASTSDSDDPDGLC